MNGYSSRFARSPYPRGTPQSKFRRLAAYPGNIPANPTNPDKIPAMHPDAQDEGQDSRAVAHDGQDELKIAKMTPRMGKMRRNMAKIRLKMARMRPKMAKMRPKTAKMKLKTAKLRLKL